MTQLHASFADHLSDLERDMLEMRRDSLANVQCQRAKELVMQTAAVLGMACHLDPSVADTNSTHYQ